jgi:hypothetical protein
MFYASVPSSEEAEERSTTIHAPRAASEKRSIIARRRAMQGSIDQVTENASKAAA